jgi:hypothetical protein
MKFSLPSLVAYAFIYVSRIFSLNIFHIRRCLRRSHRRRYGSEEKFVEMEAKRGEEKDASA